MKKVLAIIMAVFMLMSLFACNGTTPPDVDTPTPDPTVENTPSPTDEATPTDAPATPTDAATPTDVPATPTEAATPTPTQAPAVEVDALKLPTDLLEIQKSLGWWDDYARFTSAGETAIGRYDTDASDTIGHEGAGSEFFRKLERDTWRSRIKAFHDLGYKVGDWLEAQGDTGGYIIALHQNEDGSFLMDEKTGNAKVLATPWSWSTSGPAKNPEANYVTWAGLFTLVNDEPWSPNSSTELEGLSKPTYPDGTISIGYMDGDTSPAGSKFLDAHCAKDLNGNFIKFDGLGSTGTETEGTWHLVDGDGKDYYVTDFSCGKDSASPYWLEYSATTIRQKIEDGVDYFWIDNWCGWDNICTRPLQRAFGDWSEFKFKSYLAENPQIGVADTDNFSISAYVKQRAKEIEPNGDPDDISNANNAMWVKPEWVNDPVWLAYLAFKTTINTEYNTGFFNLIKDIAEEVNGDRESVAVCANDFPYTTFGAIDPECLDLVHTEYNSNYSSLTGFVTSGYPPNGYSGHAYSISIEMCRANSAVFWYYPSDYAYTDIFTKVLGYEALAYNSFLFANKSGIGTEAGNKNVLATIGKLKEDFSDRQTYADIGVVYSAESELTWLAPGGNVNGGANESTLGYMAWCHAFDELNIPYRAIFEDNLAEKINLCSVVVLPNMRVIDKETIDNVLIPYLDSGKTLVITSTYAGELASSKNSFAKNDEALLVKLAKEYSGAGKIVYYEEDPTMFYFQLNKTSDVADVYDFCLIDIENMVNEWYTDGTMTKLVSFENIDALASVVTTLHYAPTNNKYFLDIVNMQYNCDEDTLAPMPETIKATLRLPSQLWGRELSVSVMTSDKEEAIVLDSTQFTVNEAEISINIPTFDVYGCVIIEAK